jgi:hypothetical protein
MASISAGNELLGSSLFVTIALIMSVTQLCVVIGLLIFSLLQRVVMQFEGFALEVQSLLIMPVTESGQAVVRAPSMFVLHSLKLQIAVTKELMKQEFPMFFIPLKPLSGWIWLDAFAITFAELSWRGGCRVCVLVGSGMCFVACLVVVCVCVIPVGGLYG